MNNKTKREYAPNKWDALWDQTNTLCDDAYKPYFMKRYIALGEDQVMICFATAVQEGKDPKKYFRYLLNAKYEGKSYKG